MPPSPRACSWARLILAIVGVIIICGYMMPTLPARSESVRSCARVARTTYAQQRVGRRNALTGLGIGASLALSNRGRAVAEDGITVYNDEDEKFQLSVPNNWKFGKSELNNGLGSSQSYIRKVTGFVPEGAREKTNVNVVVSAVAIDFKNMGSFGSPDSFGIKLVNLVDRKFGRYKDKNVPTARLLDAYNVGDIYYAEYETFEDYSDEIGDYATKLRFFVANAIRNPGSYNRLYSVTGVCDQRDVDKFYPDIVKTVKSFNPPKSA